MAKEYKTYDEEYKKTIVSLYESGKGIGSRNIKKSSSHILKEIDDKIKFIDDNKKSI